MMEETFEKDEVAYAKGAAAAKKPIEAHLAKVKFADGKLEVRAANDRKLDIGYVDSEEADGARISIHANANGSGLIMMRCNDDGEIKDGPISLDFKSKDWTISGTETINLSVSYQSKRIGLLESVCIDFYKNDPGHPRITIVAVTY